MPDELTHVDIMVALARIEGKLDAQIDIMQKHLDDDKVLHTDHEHRVRSLETKAARQTGLVAGIAAVISGGAAFVTHFLKGGV